MVVFTCNSCGEALKRNQVDKHRDTVCNPSATLSCMDCGRDFYGNQYKEHLSCVSEAQRYQGKLYTGPKDGETKGVRKQNIWLEKVRLSANMASSRGEVISPKVAQLLQKIADYPNVPRKKSKFENFVKNSLKERNPTLLSQLWSAFSGASIENNDNTDIITTNNSDDIATTTTNNDASKLYDSTLTDNTNNTNTTTNNNNNNSNNNNNDNNNNDNNDNNDNNNNNNNEDEDSKDVIDQTNSTEFTELLHSKKHKHKFDDNQQQPEGLYDTDIIKKHKKHKKYKHQHEEVNNNESIYDTVNTTDPIQEINEKQKKKHKLKHSIISSELDDCLLPPSNKKLKMDSEIITQQHAINDSQHHKRKHKHAIL